MVARHLGLGLETENAEGIPARPSRPVAATNGGDFIGRLARIGGARAAVGH